jgi:hypothetical protein
MTALFCYSSKIFVFISNWCHQVCKQQDSSAQLLFANKQRRCLASMKRTNGGWQCFWQMVWLFTYIMYWYYWKHVIKIVFYYFQPPSMEVIYPYALCGNNSVSMRCTSYKLTNRIERKIFVFSLGTPFQSSCDFCTYVIARGKPDFTILCTSYNGIWETI